MERRDRAEGRVAVGERTPAGARLVDLERGGPGQD
jgi:hypothetical protein